MYCGDILKQRPYFNLTIEEFALLCKAWVVYSHIHNIKSQSCILSQLNPSTLQKTISLIFNIIVPSPNNSSKWYLPGAYWGQLCIYLISMPCVLLPLPISLQLICQEKLIQFTVFGRLQACEHEVRREIQNRFSKKSVAEEFK